MTFRKGTLLILSALLLTLLLAGCMGGATPGGTTSDTSGDGGTTPVGPTITVDATYQLVYKHTTDALKNAATKLSTALETVLGAKPVDGKFGAAVAAKEIVIGTVSKDRPGVPEVTYGYKDYNITVYESRIIISGGSQRAIASAVDYFIATYITGKTAVTVPSDLAYNGAIPVVTYNLSEQKNAFLLSNATAGTNGISFAAAGDVAAFKISGAEEVVATFSGTAAATYTLHLNKSANATTVSVAAGTATEVTLAKNLDPEKTYELLLIKKSGSGTSTMTTISTIGTFGKAPSNTMLELDANDNINYIKVTGRGYNCGYGITCDFSGDGFEFNVYTPTGTDVNAKFATAANTIGDGTTYFVVYIDGVKQPGRITVENTKYTTTKAFTEVPIATDLTLGTHNIRLVRMSNMWHSYVALNSLSFNGSFAERPANKDKYIEIIGDSITCGYGVIPGNNGSGYSGTAEFADATKAYSYLTAEALNADYSIRGYSGSGLAKTDKVKYAGETTDTAITIQDMYIYRNHRRNATRGVSDYFTAANNPRKPDLIIVNLGTNDESETTATAYKDKVKAFVKLLRDNNGADVPIIWVYGAMKTGFCTAIQAAMNEAGGTAKGLYYVKVTKGVSGGNGHPNEAEQLVIKNELVNFIKSNNIAGFGN